MNLVRTRRFWLWLGVAFAGQLAVLAAAGVLLRFALPPEQRDELGKLIGAAGPLLFYGALLLLAACGSIVHWLLERYPVALGRLAEEARVLLTAGPAREVTATGAAEVAEIATLFNRVGKRWQQTEQEFEVRSAEQSARLREERDRLAALMSELAEGVVVCNVAGQVLLYNARAVDLLGRSGAVPTAAGAPLGLGRSVFSVFDREAVAHALATIQQEFGREAERPQAIFLAAAPGGLPLRVRVAPFVDRGGQLAGMVFTLDEVDASIGGAGEHAKLLQSQVALRAPAMNLRVTAENLARAEELDRPQKKVLLDDLVAQSRALEGRLNAALAEYGAALKGSIALEDMRAADLLAVCGQRLAAAQETTVDVGDVAPDLWVRVDSVAIADVVAWLAGRLQSDYAIRHVQLRASAFEGLVAVDLAWLGTVMASETLGLWESEPLQTETSATPLTLGDVVSRHGGEIRYQVDRPRHRAWIRLLLPPAARATARGQLPQAAENRPEFYDFDLFDSADVSGEMAQRPLASLAYSVFDTETTGLQPSAGDEIISIGAVRVVNSRLLRQEVFEQLVDPRRPIDRESLRVHGINAASLAGQPPIERVLPRFHRYCEDTVLVAHNAAFDLRFLELKEEAAGVKFNQPVLDTLLLSAIAHPNQVSHDLDVVAQRLGVQVIGRHTALGDALVTAEIFLCLLQLLRERGIVTLGQALEASRATYLARLQY